MGKKSAKARAGQAAPVVGGAGLGIGLAMQDNPNVRTITCKDGTKLPVGKPDHLTDEQYDQVLEYLKQNPQAAKAAVQQVSGAMERDPQMTMAKLSMASHMAKPETQQKLQELKNDPDLKHMFEDIAKNGGEAMHKYADDPEIMKKFNEKMGGLPPGVMPVAPQAPPPPPQEPTEFTTLHEAARWGKADEVARMAGEGADLNAKDARGATPLGTAVGFDKAEAAQALLAAGARVDEPDAKGNTALHYAAGYGREAMAKLLLESSANAEAENENNQTPLAVATMNRQAKMVAMLGGGGQDAYL